MSNPTLLAVAHGSKDPAAQETVGVLARQIRRLAPVLDVRVAFVQHAEPALPDVLSAAGANTVIVPLLLSTGYHLRTDIARAASEVGARVADQLGPDLLLVTALAGRLTQAGVPDGTPVVLAAGGSSDPAAEADIQAQAALLAERLAVPVVPAYASAGRPRVPEAVADLRERTGQPVAVATYLLAPGHFHDQLQHAGARWVTAPLGGHPAMAGLVIDRYRTASRRPAAATAGSAGAEAEAAAGAEAEAAAAAAGLRIGWRLADAAVGEDGPVGAGLRARDARAP
ncbi:MAG TPA: sirohydrochlorin chelatase [Streptosporangiaceae bacterium]|nr:sirohydrochlorin chelatase [Streptosporangiaceae bacterium]